MIVGPGLCLERVVVRYGAHVAVDGLTLAVAPGEIVGLLGPNGCGKSSTLAVAAGLIHPAFGSARIESHVSTQHPRDYARNVGFVPQDAALYDDLSATANLTFFGQLQGLRGATLKTRIATALKQARLEDRARARVGTFSGGMKQRLNLAAALLHNPAVVLLDEPTAALDPASRECLYGDLAELRNHGKAVLLSTHHWDEASTVCDRVVVMEAGRVMHTGTPGEILRPTGLHVLYGHLTDWVEADTLAGLQAQLEPGLDLEITGRRVRLSAGDSIALGRGLAVLLSAGLTMESFRTPPGRVPVSGRVHSTPGTIPQ